MLHSSRVAIGEMRVSSHGLEIEMGRALDIPREEWICKVEMEDEEHFVCRCRAYADIRGRYESVYRAAHPLRDHGL
ncbi:hypothetical protein KP509_21G040600 [Ceratopteris richardii]|nr:hypothetical protein KP509_21G040600 [Ceratopteris richardii]